MLEAQQSAGGTDRSTVLDGFRDWVAKTPDEPAVRCGDLTLTYAELDAAADRLAAVLAGRGVCAESVVGLAVRRDANLAVGVLATAKIGAAYLPLDPDHPADRIRLMLADAGASIVMTQVAVTATMGSAGWGERVSPLHLDEPIAGDPAAGTVDPASAPAGPDSLLYVIYTSGSTGRPKGIAMQQGPQIALLNWCVNHYAERPCALQYFPITADVAYLELLSTWWLGGCAVIATEHERYDVAALADLIRDRRISKVLLPVVALDQLARHTAGRPSDVATLREVITTGDRLAITPAVREMLSALPSAYLDNHYGSTEVNVVTAPRLTSPAESWPQFPAIGRPMSDARIYVLDQNLAPVPPNVPGEIYVGGPPLARGYLGRAALTAAAFLPDPFSDRPGARMYRIGDLGRWRPNGVLQFIGRADFQIKLHGYRIEPGEIEALLCARADVTEAVVVLVGEGESAMLAAYFVAADQPPAASELRDQLAGQLPAHMIPQAFVPLPELPLTGTGKVDRKGLPAPAEFGPAFTAPRDALEQLIAEVFADVLGVDRISVDLSFFGLGGHSLLVTQVAYRIRAATGADLPLKSVFEHPTVAALAAEIRRTGGELARPA
ncbi:non-ribosomal peptide synthetase [Actinoplanes sp. NPDC051470]|uniref:non-ribosomal peptide synthetase n=1 Tax=Actinoplanes sp. NPDC051470 TaxID=3157224 RepID=UPI003422C082